MFDFEKLIVEIETKPCIWNINDHDYHNRHLKSLAWNSIGETMFSDWSELLPTEKDERGKIVYNLYNYSKVVKL